MRLADRFRTASEQFIEREHARFDCGHGEAVLHRVQRLGIGEMSDGDALLTESITMPFSPRNCAGDYCSQAQKGKSGGLRYHGAFAEPEIARCGHHSITP